MYFVGGIRFELESPWMDLGEAQREKRFNMVDIIFEPISSGTSDFPLIRMEVMRDFNTTVMATRNLNLEEVEGDGHYRWTFSKRARHLKFKLFHLTAETPVEIKRIIYGSELRGIR